jgi:hypothetical protein
LGSGCQHCRRTMGGRRDGCCGSVQRAQWVFETRGGPWDGKGSAGHAGVGLGWQTGKLNFTHGPAALISYSSTSSRNLGYKPRSRTTCRHRPVSVNPANEAARGGRVVGLQQGPPELAWAAPRSECILQERRGSTHKQPQCKPWTCPHTWGQLMPHRA